MRYPLVGIPMTLAALIATGCNDPAQTPRGPQERAFQGLCQAEALARDGDVDEADRVFRDRSHDYLHELADRVQAVDRAAAAMLLEAKQRVEAALAGATKGSELAAQLDELQGAFAAAAEAVGPPAPSCKEAA